MPSKNILTAPPGDDVLAAVGGSGGAAVNDGTLALAYQSRDFAKKEDYQGMDIVQPAAVVLNATRDRVLVTFRVDAEAGRDGDAGGTVARKTTGDSILLSSSKVPDPAAIVGEKVAAGLGNVTPLDVRFTGANVLGDGTRYFFDVGVAAADETGPLAGADPDKRMEFATVGDALARLKGAMEKRILELLQAHLAAVADAGDVEP